MIRILTLAVLLLGLGAGPVSALDLTPAQTEGPYYPRRKPADTDADLTRIGAGPQAKGVVLMLEARALDPRDSRSKARELKSGRSMRRASTCIPTIPG